MISEAFLTLVVAGVFLYGYMQTRKCQQYEKMGERLVALVTTAATGVIAYHKGADDQRERYNYTSIDANGVTTTTSMDASALLRELHTLRRQAASANE